MFPGYVGRASGWDAAAASLISVALVARIWRACDVGPAVGTTVLFVDLPVLGTLTLARLIGTAVLLRGARFATALVLTSVATEWLHLSIRHNPGGNDPTPVCEDGIPAWWPGWIRL